MSDGTTSVKLRRGSRRPPNQDPAKLRRRRVEAGLSLTALSQLIGYSKGHLSECESPDRLRSASPELLAVLAEALGCRIRDLMPDEAAA